LGCSHPKQPQRTIQNAPITRIDAPNDSAVVAERPGPLTDVLRLHTAPPVDDPLGEGEVLVRMLASTVNPSDAVTVSGAYGSRTVFPFVPGFEGVGAQAAVQ